MIPELPFMKWLHKSPPLILEHKRTKDGDPRKWLGDQLHKRTADRQLKVGRRSWVEKFKG